MEIAVSARGGYPAKSRRRPLVVPQHERGFAGSLVGKRRSPPPICSGTTSRLRTVRLELRAETRLAVSPRSEDLGIHGLPELAGAGIFSVRPEPGIKLPNKLLGDRKE